jgi:transposase
MAKRKRITLTTKDEEELQRISKSRSESRGRVQRAQMILKYSQGQKITGIAREMQTNRPLIERTIDKALAYGPIEALKDLPRAGRPADITEDDKSWALAVACSRPTDWGYAHETWTYRLLSKNIRLNCKKHGFPNLANLGNERLHNILSKSNIKPHKMSYYLERRDPDFEKKMADVLYVYKQVEIQNHSQKKQRSVTISYDEKPGIQATKNIAVQLLPVIGQHSTTSRDHQYKRLGTVSLLAGIDLHNGQIISLVQDRHRSQEFIKFLQKVDQNYPNDWKIRMILDNHSAHLSKETQAYLKTTSGRFEFIFTPKHGSWLNLVEVFFSKIARSFLRHIRVDSKQELSDRIYQGIEDMNREPVVFRWRYRMNETHHN